MYNEKSRMILTNNQKAGCEDLQDKLLHNRSLIIAANRGPVTIQSLDDGTVQYQRIGGGLVTALLGLAHHVEANWIVSAVTDDDRTFGDGWVPSGEDGEPIHVQFLAPDHAAYDGYYNVISNPLLWFLQHSLWDLPRCPTIDRSTWDAWNNGYVVINRQFASAIARMVRESTKPSLIMLQDYQLYLVSLFLRELLPSSKQYTLTHFIHIPWPGPEIWGMLPAGMRLPILESLCSVDLLGFQTREDGLNFIRTCENYLPDSHLSYRDGRIEYRDHTTYIRDFPISINVNDLRELSMSEEVSRYRNSFQSRWGQPQFIVRVDRTEPSKNIVRGFQAYDELLEMFPEHHGKVMFLALLVPSRLGVEEYQSYLDELMAAAGRVNARHGDSEWEPVRVLVGDNYQRAIAALQIYDVLLVNSISDGMNLVTKEGPIVNQRDGVVVLSERTGAVQQLESGSIVIPPCDVFATALALHQALVMPAQERQAMAKKLVTLIEQEDINHWLCKQLETIDNLNL